MLVGPFVNAFSVLNKFTHTQASALFPMLSKVFFISFIEFFCSRRYVWFFLIVSISLVKYFFSFSFDVLFPSSLSCLSEFFVYDEFFFYNSNLDLSVISVTVLHVLEFSFWIFFIFFLSYLVTMVHDGFSA